LFLTTDARLGRPMLIERFAPGLLQSEAGALHLAWLRAMARLAGPGLQRVLRIDLGSQPSAQVYYEAPSGTPVSTGVRLSRLEREQVLRVLTRLHNGGLVHGALLRSLIREPAQPLLLISGRGPLFWSVPPTPAEDIAALGSLSG
jgi:hypothetical protein